MIPLPKDVCLVLITVMRKTQNDVTAATILDAVLLVNNFWNCSPIFL